MKRHPAEAGVAQDELEKLEDNDSLPDLQQKLKSNPPLPICSLLVTLFSETLFYVGAWILALYVLFHVSRARTHAVAIPIGVPGGAPASDVSQAYHSQLFMPDLTAASTYATLALPPKNDDSKLLLALAPHRTPSALAKMITDHRSILLGTAAALEPPLVPPPLSSLVSASSFFELPSAHVAPTALNTIRVLPEPTPRGEASMALPELPLLVTPPALVARAPPAHSPSMRSANEEDCRAVRQEQGVVPGKSWGRLPKVQQSEWMAQRCDRYFCKPHRLEGKGIYKCEPI
jgi:hypothetical protein